MTICLNIYLHTNNEGTVQEYFIILLSVLLISNSSRKYRQPLTVVCFGGTVAGKEEIEETRESLIHLFLILEVRGTLWSARGVGPEGT